MNLKKLKILYISSLFIIVITCISGAYYFLKDRTDENYIAYVEVKTSKSIDHIFLAGSVDALMTEYMTRSLNQLIPAYDWEFNTANNMFRSPYPLYGIIFTSASSIPVSFTTSVDTSKALPASG